jgi:hypothetical protein
MMPLPHSGDVVVVVVELDVLDVLVELGGGLVVVVVLLTSGAHRTCTRRLPASVFAHAAPVNVAPRPRASFALGARTKARTSLPALKRTLPPRTFRSGVGVPFTGPSVDPFSARTSPATLMVVWVAPLILTLPRRPTCSWQML